MNSSTLQDVQATLAARGLVHEQPFEYFKGRYCFFYLRRLIRAHGGALPVAKLKRSAFARLAAKPPIERLIQRTGGVALTEASLDRWEDAATTERYVHGFSTWGSDKEQGGQTVRQGTNLVIQLNFDRAHDERYRALVKPARGKRPFGFLCHPISESRNTMAWARVDLDLQHGEALIEEIQTDWLRETALVLSRVMRHVKGGATLAHWEYADLGIGGSHQQAARYIDTHAAPHAQHWAEAMLTATLRILVGALRIRRIYYHSPESGKVLRNCRWWEPPTSLYTDLPKAFLFRETRELPHFLVNEKQMRPLLRTGTVPPLFLLEI